jgi:acyl-CoA thioester hydrolase
MLVPYDLATGRPRRLSEAERDFLAAWKNTGSGPGSDSA